MARRRWMADGLVVEAPEMARDYQSCITEAWDYVVRAREAFLAGDWEQTDRWSREACRVAARALVFSRGYRPAGEFPQPMARDYSFDTFGGMGDELFGRAELVGEFLPYTEEPTESRRRLFGKTVVAASSLVALVECHIAVEQSPPEEPPDPHAPRSSRRSTYY